MTEQFENRDIISILNKWKMPLLIVLIGSVVLSSVFSSSYFIEEKFRSVAVIYPANISTFGSESEVEQAIQTLQSEDIVEKIIQKFDLVKHYGLDPASPIVQTLVRKELKENVSIGKTEFESIEIEAYDKSPQTALDMVNMIITLYNEKVGQLRKERMEEVLATVSFEMHKKKAEKDTLENQLDRLRTQYGLLDYGVQTQEVLRGYYRAISDGVSSVRTKEMEEVIGNLKEKGGSFIELSERAWRVRAEFLDLKNQYENALKEVNRQQSYANIITRPLLPDKKAYPIRWLIVMISSMAALFLSILIISWLESYRKDATG